MAKSVSISTLNLSTASLCLSVINMMNSHDDVSKSPLSIAARRDYGLLSRIKELEPFLNVERSLMSPFRLYASVIKVSKYGRSVVSGLKGDVIMFPHGAPDVAPTS
jgi:hypothetical protein